MFPNESYPGILHDLNNLPFEFRYCCRYIALDKHDAAGLFDSYAKKWMQKRKGFLGVLREAILREPSPVENSAATVQAQDAEAVRQETELDLVSQGFFTATVVVLDKDIEAVEEKAKTIEKVINGRQFTAIYERMNASEAFLGSLPGNCYANVRKPIINSLNLSHIMPVSSIWSGFAKNEHLNAPPLMVADTAGAMPFNVSFHHGELGHLLVMGPSRSGKTFFINLCASQFMRYPNAHVVHFDKDLGGYVACLAHGGAHYRLSARGGVALQPLGRIDDPAERSWAAGWLHQLLHHRAKQRH
jgi:type IV secretion system protein VirB4